MWRTWGWLALSFSLVATVAVAQEAKKGKAGDDRPAADRFRDDPSDADALRTIINETMMSAIRTMDSDPKGAEQKFDELQVLLDKVNGTTPAVKNAVTTGKAMLSSYRQRLKLQAVSLAELQKKVEANPTDTLTVSSYLQKALMEISPLTRSKPDEAGEKLNALKAVLDKSREAIGDGPGKAVFRSADQVIANLEKSIEAGKKLTALIGKDAAPLKVEAWVNGAPLTDSDLKGKVVFLDFWAVWCGPCIATFPHLVEWNEKYADKGLVMIGLTNYYNFKWDEDAKEAARSTDKVTHEEEQAMLKKFAASHDLKHRIAIQADHSLAEYYGVTGIPHVVVIDQEGKIRLMKVGSGDANAKEIGDLLAKLLEK